MAGTPAYLAPELIQALDQGADACCDVYGLGVMLYEMLTGRVPFRGSLYEVMKAIVEREPDPPTSSRPELSPALEAICLRAMRKSRDDRYASMASFAAALEAWLATRDDTLRTMTARRPLFDPANTSCTDGTGRAGRYGGARVSTLPGRGSD